MSAQSGNGGLLHRAIALRNLASIETFVPIETP
jgi:hypothetical protein